MLPVWLPVTTAPSSTSDQCNRNRHKRKKHPAECEMENWRKSHIRCLEEDCGFAADSTDQLSKHLTEKHGIKLTEVEKEFESFEGHGKALHANTTVTQQTRLFLTKKALKQKENSLKPTTEEAGEICSNYLADFNP